MKLTDNLAQNKNTVAKELQLLENSMQARGSLRHFEHGVSDCCGLCAGESSSTCRMSKNYQICGILPNCRIQWLAQHVSGTDRIYLQAIVGEA